ncbi:ExbD/TolR family protein [Flavobacterium hungaricum]|uniref:Biopolymer transporter ExbD n=1 Tax=Flavobacterium hungaricum TaxID=2082725 RepID=A0ABR9THI6_9FLAO|nr:biopolymer transporter ExbD [Flavobacterium hungaricum]MBE8724820.1 biopolymer transporter ExbD [Flavobacterium hungaricum]
MKNLPQKVRSRKLSSRVDLTAMVSVSFLLIIFFMVVGELAKPKIMDLSMPERHCDDGVISCFGTASERTLTVLLDKNNEIITYENLFFPSLEKPKKLAYGKNGIRKELEIQKKKILDYYGDSRKSLFVIIKPSTASNFKNLVDILDEMAIAGIGTYAIVNEFSPEETKLLAAK